MRYITTSVRLPLVALTVTVVGVLLASWWFGSQRWWLLIGLIPLTAGLASGWFGDRLLPASPVAALWFMEWWILVPLTVAVFAAGAVVLAGVVLTVPSAAPVVTSKEFGTLGTGVTTFLTAAFIAWTNDADSSPAAQRIRSAFQKHYRQGTYSDTRAGVHFFAPESKGYYLAQANGYGVTSWDWSDRHARARGIAVELSSGQSDPKPPAAPAWQGAHPTS